MHVIGLLVPILLHTHVMYTSHSEPTKHIKYLLKVIQSSVLMQRNIYPLAIRQLHSSCIQHAAGSSQYETSYIFCIPWVKNILLCCTSLMS